MKQVAFKRSVFVWLRAVMLVTAAVVFYIVGPARPVQAVQDPVCDPSLKWSCVAGTAQNKVYNSGSRCWTWQCVWGYSVNCTQCSGCGNDKIDPGEDCDGLNLNNKTCRDLGYDGGALSCFPESCNFDESRCTKAARCGNNQLDSGEQCDGSILNNPQYDTNKDNRVDCRDFGFTSGVLSCSGCNFNTDQCGRCGNGILEAGEECDGFNFGNQTCQTAGCQAGRLLCGLTCKVDKSQCTGCVGQCQTTTMSVWSAPNNFNKSCCGSANGQFFTDLNSKSPNLCSGSQSAALFGEYDADGALLTNNSKKELAAWAWKCVNDSCDQNCLAYKKAECAVEVSSAGDSCEPGKIFNNFVSYQTALCKRVGTGSNQSKEWIEKCAKYGVPAGWQGSDRDNSPACAGGKQIANSVCRPLGSSWLNQNQEWTCAGTGPQGVKNEARCSVGWRQDSVCGSANGQDYKTGKGYCRDDAAWKEFFGLSNRADNDVKLCGSGSKVYLPNTFKRYWMAPWGVFEPTETSEYDGFDYPWFKYFSWQCRYDVTSNSRKGEPVNCRARLLDTNCDGDNAICGPAVNKKFPYFSQGPTTGFCQTGKLGGSIGSKVKFSQDTHTWSWTCLSASGESRVAKCSVQATVFCGAAMTSGKEYTTFDAVKKAGACGGANGVLVDNTIEDKGVAWQWACADKTDDTVYTLCQAPTGRCGHAGGRTFLESTFDGNKSNNGFLCPAGVTAGNLSGPDYNASFKVNQWNWSCGQTVCSARQLACGQAGAENYFRAMFEKQVAATPTFLCSSSFGAVNLSYQDNLDKGTSDAMAVWTWDCVGDDGDTVKNCSTRRYACGWANGRKVAKFYDKYWPTPSTLGGGWVGKGPNSEFCTYDAKRGDLEATETGATWTCSDPNNPSKYEVCSADFVTCGSVTDNHDAYFAAPGYIAPSYYQATIDAHSGKNDGYLCLNSSKVRALTNDGKNISWYCSDDFGRGQLQFDGSGKGICQVKSMTCGSGNNKIFNGRFEWKEQCVLPLDQSGTCLCSNGNNASVDKQNPGRLFPDMRDRGFNFKPRYQAEWYCLDSAGQKGQLGDAGASCQAKAY